MLRPSPRPSLVAALLLAGAISVGCTGGLTPPTRPLGQPDFTLSSAAFVTEFLKDSVAAQKKYADRVVELTGKLVTIHDEEDGRPLCYLEGPDPEKLDRAYCLMTERFPWSKANPGQTVTLKGRSPHEIYVPRLEGCEILTVTGPPLPHLTADEFAARLADPDLVKKRREGVNYFIVSGEMDRLHPSWSGLYLKTQPTHPKVLVQFEPRDYKRLGVESWKPGLHLEVIGGDSSNPGAQIALLVECLLMDDPK